VSRSEKFLREALLVMCYKTVAHELKCT